METQDTKTTIATTQATSCDEIGQFDDTKSKDMIKKYHKVREAFHWNCFLLMVIITSFVFFKSFLDVFHIKNIC